jgi:hypothetical protein
VVDKQEKVIGMITYTDILCELSAGKRAGNNLARDVVMSF